jgi:hypothetical protein
LISEISLEDEGLKGQIEQELHALDNAEAASKERFVPDASVGALRQALAALGEHGGDQVRAQLRNQLEQAQRADAERRELLASPVVEFRRALEQLANWAEVWRGASTEDKNQLLREVGMQVTLGTLPEDDAKGRPYRVLSISVENPAFELALATALSARNETLGSQQTCNGPNDHMELKLRGQYRLIAERLLRVDEDSVRLRRVRLGRREAPLKRPGPRWLSLEDFAERARRSPEEIEQLVVSGVIARARCQQFSGQSWIYVHELELVRLATAHLPRIGGAYELDRETQGALLTWLRGALRAWPTTWTEKARRAGLAALTSASWVADGHRSIPRLATVHSLTRAVVSAQPSAEATRYLSILDELMKNRVRGPARILYAGDLVEPDLQTEIVLFLRAELNLWRVPNATKAALTGRHPSSLTEIADGRCNPTLETTVAILRALLHSRPSVDAQRFLRQLDVATTNTDRRAA